MNSQSQVMLFPYTYFAGSVVPALLCLRIGLFHHAKVTPETVCNSNIDQVTLTESLGMLSLSIVLCIWHHCAMSHQKDNAGSMFHFCDMIFALTRMFFHQKWN